MNTYSVARINNSDGSEEIIAEGLTNIEAARLVGVQAPGLTGYIKRNGIANKIYKIYIDGQTDKGKYDSELEEVYEAAELIRSGHGKIVMKLINGKWQKVTVRI